MLHDVDKITYIKKKKYGEKNTFKIGSSGHFTRIMYFPLHNLLPRKSEYLTCVFGDIMFVKFVFLVNI